jgi:TetR/AcrR family transcriptional regulator
MARAAARAASHRRPARRRPGRPRAVPGRDVRRDLLAAARTMFLRYGYRAVSARQVAAEAGTHPAMVQYYFGSKQGLYAAMLQEAIAPLRARVETMLMAPDAEAPDLPALLEAYMRTVAAHPWVPGLLVRDVLAPGGEFRERFIRDFAGRVAPRVATLAGRATRRGRLRADLDPTLTVVSLLSLGLWPFLAMPVLSGALGLKADAAFVEKLIRHTVRLFAAGTAAGEPT